MISNGKYHIFQDAHAEDTEGNNYYVMEMERACELYDMVRFQYTAARVFADELVDIRVQILHDEATKEAVAKTAEAKAGAREAAKADPKEAMEAAEEAVTIARPKPIENHASSVQTRGCTNCPRGRHRRKRHAFEAIKKQFTEEGQYYTGFVFP